MAGGGEGVEFSHDQDFGTGFPGVEVSIESGDISGAGQCVASLLKDPGKVGVGVPLLESCLRVRPDIALCFQNFAAVLFHQCAIVLLIHKCLQSIILVVLGYNSKIHEFSKVYNLKFPQH